MCATGIPFGTQINMFFVLANKIIYIIIEGIKSHYFAQLCPCLNQSKQINQKGKLLPGSANRDEITCHYSTANVRVFDNWLIKDNKQLDT